MLSMFNQRNRGLTQELLQSHRDKLSLLGDSLHVLYLAATCHRKCWGGGHQMEYMAGRVYNNACAAYSLICIGYYDEALNLVRSLGETANLIALFHMDSTAFPRWAKASKRERIENFGPAKVRKRLKDEPGGVLLMDDAQYAELCENFTHPTPGVAPNSHNELERAICGGIVQEKGLSDCLGELASMVGSISLYYAKLFGFEDLFEELATSYANDSPASTSPAPPSP